MSEPSSPWTDIIADTTLCGYFYVFFIIYSVLAALAVISFVYMMATTKITGGLATVVLISTLIKVGLLGTTALFLYLICDRSLKSKQVQKAPKHVASGSGLLL